MGSELAAIWGCNSVNIVSLCSSEGFKNVAFCFTATVFLFVYRSLSFLLWPLMFPLFSSSPFSLSPAASLCYCHFPFPVGVKFASIIIMLFCVYGLPWHILCVQRLFIKLGKTNYKMPKPTFSAAKKKNSLHLWFYPPVNLFSSWSAFLQSSHGECATFVFYKTPAGV